MWQEKDGKGAAQGGRSSLSLQSCFGLALRIVQSLWSRSCLLDLISVLSLERLGDRSICGLAGKFLDKKECTGQVF